MVNLGYNYENSYLEGRNDGFSFGRTVPLKDQIIADLNKGRSPDQIIKSMIFPLIVGYVIVCSGIVFMLWAMLMAFLDEGFHPALSLIGFLPMGFGLIMIYQITKAKQSLLRVKNGEDPQKLFS